MRARSRSDPRDLLGRDLVEQLEADRPTGRLHPRLHPGVAVGDAVHEEARPHLVVFGEEAVGVGHEDPSSGVGIRGAHLEDRVALGPRRIVGPSQEVGLARLLDGLGQDLHLVRTRCVLTRQRDDVGRPGVTTRRGCCRLGRITQTVFAEVSGVGEAGRRAANDTDPCAPLPARHHLLHPAVVEPGGGGAPILHEDLGEITAVAQRRAQRAIEDGLVDQLRHRASRESMNCIEVYGRVTSNGCIAGDSPGTSVDSTRGARRSRGCVS